MSSLNKRKHSCRVRLGWDTTPYFTSLTTAQHKDTVLFLLEDLASQVFVFCEREGSEEDKLTHHTVSFTTWNKKLAALLFLPPQPPTRNQSSTTMRTVVLRPLVKATLSLATLAWEATIACSHRCLDLWELSIVSLQPQQWWGNLFLQTTAVLFIMVYFTHPRAESV